ncbi:MAG: GntR family transcriptional regulator [Candidatus Aminicenantes bacterium]|nr:GntR family transcriptional regulator [Candidatus Aminicenantes bacterium]NIM78936.1 GntR family transcriptional regulator [Candidatus Aminicenantes bacterium]NIN18196.1 GntR family transcriptional regulator [Candidatus Aminicenantes bacterium]NIN42095.1 GntR family transcriptional regulator [Candidatus Aminicenantes bacterium]NIN84848.1 GntR family transcriptional regulator [Candidatus Aminicenantes bacterium]
MQIKKDTKPLDMKIDARSALPVYEQVKQGIKLLIASGYLGEGDRLVPIRELASQLRINPNTIVKVYYQLDVEGYIYSQPGSGYFVKGGAAQKQEERDELFASITEDYVSKASNLGFSLEDMISQLEKKITPTKREFQGESL